MKIRLLVLACVVLFFHTSIFGQVNSKPRLLITTDIGGDPDDQQSMVRLLLYANEFDIEGLIASASGIPGELKKDTVKYGLLLDYIEAYREVYPNLKKHDSNYPSPDYLKSIAKKGNKLRGWQNVGKGHDTDGSEWIIKVVDKKDERPVNIAIWGGQSDLAQALWKVKNTRSKSQFKEFCDKIKIYDIGDQDGIFENMIEEFSEISFYILNKAPKGADKRNAVFRGMYLGGNEMYTSLQWVNNNIRENHRKLGSLYPDKTWTAPNPHGVLKEGDTPAWFYFLTNGLQDPKHPEYGGWGGRFEKGTNGIYRDAPDFVNGNYNYRSTVHRWRPYFQNEFAARADRCVKTPDEVNHPPVISVSGNNKNKVETIVSREGESLYLDASATSDPDNDELSFLWWVYPEAGTVQEHINLGYNQKSKIKFDIPNDLAGSQIHLILQVTDNGEPTLTSFRRIIIDIK